MAKQLLKPGQEAVVGVLLEDLQEEDSVQSRDEIKKKSFTLAADRLKRSRSGETDEESDQTDSSQAQSDEPTSEPEEVMTTRSNRKFERPPSFSGSVDEDAIEWAEKYEKIGDYNGWSCKEKHDNVFMYLKGSAEKWFKGLTPMTKSWLDVEVSSAGVVVVTLGVRARLLESFSVGNYKQYHLAKLQNRMQSDDESGVDYYYDVIALCKVVDPVMTEPDKVNHLMRGLGACLTFNIYKKINEIKTAEGFLKMVRSEEEAVSLFKKKNGKKIDTVAGLTSQPSKYDRDDQNASRDELDRQQRLLDEKYDLYWQKDAIDEKIRALVSAEEEEESERHFAGLTCDEVEADRTSSGDDDNCVEKQEIKMQIKDLRNRLKKL